MVLVSMKFLHVLVVHAAHLTYRKSFLSATLKLLEDMSNKRSYKFRMHMVQEHELQRVKDNFKEIEKILEHHKIGDEDFDRGIQQLSIEQISNFLKQRAALQKVVELESFQKEGDKHYYLILEDDSMILPEFVKNAEIFLENPEVSPWDILFLCLSQPGQQSSYELLPTRGLVKVLPSKEAYCITPSTAAKLLPSLEKINYFYRLQLSVWIHQNPSIRSVYPNLRISLEGSKVGFVPSSVVDNNLLIYNKEFMEMLHMMTGKETMDFQKVRKSYKMVEHIQSPDIMHLFGVILYKHDKKEAAKEMFLNAINQMNAKNGCISARSELLNNTINIHGVCQDDLEVCKRKPSKYTNVTF